MTGGFFFFLGKMGAVLIDFFLDGEYSMLVESGISFCYVRSRDFIGVLVFVVNYCGT